jgi:hypothetical protein
MEELAPWEQDYSEETEAAPWEQDYSEGTENLPAEANSVAERAVTLPTPRPNMFAEMADDEAAMTYDAYKRHPETTQDEEGNLLYKGIAIPNPEGNGVIPEMFAKAGQIIFSGMSPSGNANRREVLGQDPEELSMSESIGRGVGGGAYETGRNIAETGLAAATSTPLPSLIEAATGADVVPQPVEDLQSAAATGFEDTVPKFNPEGTTEHIGSTGTQIAGGIVIGNKALAAGKAAGLGADVLDKFAKTMPKLGWLTKKTVESAIQGAGTAATVDDQSDTLVTGENAVLGPIFDGINTDDPNEMTAMANRRLNILLDSALIAMPIEAAADGGRRLAKVIYSSFFEGSHKVVSKDKQQIGIIQDILDMVRRAADPKDPNSPQALAAQEELIEKMRNPEYQEVFIPIDKDGVSDVAYRRDTASAVEAGLGGDTSDSADLTRTVFREHRKRAVEDAKSGFRETQVAEQQPVKATEKLLQESEEVFGGNTAARSDSVDAAGAGIRKSGYDEIDRSAQTADDAMNEARKAESALPDTLREGPLGEAITEAEMGGFAAGRQRRNEVAGEILDAERQGSKTLRKGASARWENIPEGLEADAESFLQVVADANDSGALTPALKRALKKVGLDMDALKKASQEADPEDVDFDPFEGLSFDFKQLQQLRASLSREIDRTWSSPEFDSDALIAIRENLNETQPEHIIDTYGDSEGAEALKEARRYYSEDYAPVAKAGLPKKLSDVRRDKNLRKDHPARSDALREKLHTTLTSDQPREAQHFVETLSRPEYGEAHPLIVKYAYADAADKIANKIIAGEGLTSVNPDEIVSGLMQYRQVLNSNPQYAKEVAELDSFIGSIQAAKGDVKRLQEIAKTRAADVEQLKEKIFKTSLKEFYSQHGDALPNGYESLVKLFRDPQATGKGTAGRLDDVIRRAKESDDPLVMDGIKAAWMRYVRDSIFEKAPSATSQRAVKAEVVDDFLKGTGGNNLLTAGRKIFDGEDQVLVDSLETILKPALDVAVSAKSGSSQLAKGSPLNEAKEGVAAAVRLKFGPLTREGTMINTLFAKGLQLIVKNKKQEAALDAIMADPDGFLKAYDLFVKSAEPMKERARHFFKWAVNSGVYNEGDRNQFEKEFREANQETETEEALPPAPDVRKVTTEKKK